MLVIYFHGLGSGSECNPKVKVLRDAGFRVVAPVISTNPVYAEEHLTSYIIGALNVAIASGETKFAFVGTSLGGYWAAAMGNKFEAKQVLINPSFDPTESLDKYTKGDGFFNYVTNKNELISSVLLPMYEKIDPEDTASLRSYFISKNDPVVKPAVPSKFSTVKMYDSDDHRGDSFFNDVIEHLKDMNA